MTFTLTVQQIANIFAVDINLYLYKYNEYDNVILFEGRELACRLTNWAYYIFFVCASTYGHLSDKLLCFAYCHIVGDE